MNDIYLNPFIEACQSVLESFEIQSEHGEPFPRQSPFLANSIVVVIGITGALHGQAMISMDQNTACEIASTMMFGMEVSFDETTKSAIGELANMIIGNSVTLLSQTDIMIDITPPSVLSGSNIHVSSASANYCVPFTLSTGSILEFSLTAKEIR